MTHASFVSPRIAFYAPPAPPPNLNFPTRKGLTPSRWPRCCPGATIVLCAEAAGNVEWDIWDTVGDDAERGNNTIGEGDNLPRRKESKPSRVAVIAQAVMFAVGAVGAGFQPLAAAVTGGRISGGYTLPDRAPSPPPTQQQQQYQAPPQQYTPPSAGRDIRGAGDSRVHIDFRGKEGSRRGNRIRVNPGVEKSTSDAISAGDVAVIGGFTTGVMAIQRYNRRRFLQESGGGYESGSSTSAAVDGHLGKETAVVTSLQLSMFCDRQAGKWGILTALEDLSRTANVKSPRGLSVLVSEVCLTLLRAERDWIGAAGSIKEYRPHVRGARKGKKNESSRPSSRAKRDFNRAVTRERSKWERETVYNTPDQGFSSSNKAPGRRGLGVPDSTYAVATLVVAWARLRSISPTSETRKSTRRWLEGDNRDDHDRDVVFTVVNRKSVITFLEWIVEEAAEGRGENLLDVEVLWTPADPDDSLDRDDLDVKWPELRGI